MAARRGPGGADAAAARQSAQLRLDRGFRLDQPAPPRLRDPPREIPAEPSIGDAASALNRARESLAAGVLSQALLWSARALALAPNDQNVRATRASALFAVGDMAAAEAMFLELAARHDLPVFWRSAALAAERQGEVARAAAAAQRLIASGVLNAAIFAECARMALAAGFTGAAALAAPPSGHGLTVLTTAAANWCRPGHRALRQDRPIPANWPAIEVLPGDDGRWIGQHLSPARVLRAEGIVCREGQMLSGWVWHPGDPSRVPRLSLRDETGRQLRRLTARDFAPEVSGAAALLAARSFATEWPRGARSVSVITANGRPLTGSPLPASLRRRPARGGPARPATPPPGDVIVPVYRDEALTLACLAAARAALPDGWRLIVVDDATPEPALAELLRQMADAGQIVLIGSDGLPGPGQVNRGFVAAANAGLSHCPPGRDVLLLNSDAILTEGAVRGLQAALHAGPAIGTATPLSNAATIFTWPRQPPDAPDEALPGPDELAARAALAARVNHGRLVEVPTAHGFCMMIRADCRAAVGALRADIFAQGYGEENAFCEAASAAGFARVAVPGIYVGHAGGVSFGNTQRELLARNLGLLERLYPGYAARIGDWIARDPLRPARARLDRARFLDAAAGRQAVLLIGHDSGGGTARVIAARAAAIAAAGQRAIVLQPAPDGFATLSADGVPYADLGAYLPTGRAGLASLLREAAVVRVEIHHLLNHHVASIRALLAELSVPYDVHIHDWWWLCPQLTFIDHSGRFCGEAEGERCSTCVRAAGSRIEERLSTEALRRRSHALLSGADSVLVATEDARARLCRHFPDVAPQIIPWEVRAESVPPANPPAKPGHAKPVIIAVIGAIGHEKGFEMLRACGEDAARRNLALSFVLVGFSRDDAALLATGRIFVTGAYPAGEARARIAQTGADLAFIPSIWPETWCFTLSEAWECGLEAVVFDIGAQAERVRADGRGLVLPLALPPGAVNDALILAARRARRRGV